MKLPVFIRKLLSGDRSQSRPAKYASRPMARGRSSQNPQVQGFNGSYFEALRQSDDRTPIMPSALVFGSRPNVTGVERATLSALARAVYDNGGLPAMAVDQIAFHSSPIKPMADTGDEEMNATYEAYWEEWTQRCDFHGRIEMDFDALQKVICQSLDLDGDLGVTLVSESGWPQVQLVPGWRIQSSSETGNTRAMDGVVLDKMGRVTGYMVAAGEEDPKFLSVGEMMLVREPNPTSWYRGLSPMRRGLNDIRDAKDIMAFEKLAVKKNAALDGVIEGGPLDEDHGFSPSDPYEDEDEEPAPPADDPLEKTGISRAELLGGDIPSIPEGQKYTPIPANRPNAQFDSFIELLSGAFIAGLDVPPAFFLDRRLTGPAVRSVIGKAQRKFNDRADVMKRLVRWIWVRVIGWGVANNEIPSHPNWWGVTFNQPARATIDAGRESAQEREDNAHGLMSRQEHYGNRGLPWKPEVDQLFNEESYIIEKAELLSKKTGIPVSMILTRFGYQQPKNPTNPKEEA